MKNVLGWLTFILATIAALILSLFLSFQIVPSITTSYAVWIYDTQSDHTTIILKATLAVDKGESHRYLNISTAYDALYTGEIYQIDRTTNQITGYGDDGVALETTRKQWTNDSLQEVLEPFQTYIRELREAEIQEIKSVIDDIIVNGYAGMSYALQESPTRHKKSLVMLDAYGPASSPFIRITYGWVPVWLVLSFICIWGAWRLTRPLRKSKRPSAHCDAQTHG